MREILFFIASIAGAAVLTALGIVLAPTSPVWRWVLWGGASVFIGCASILAIDYFKPDGQWPLKSALGIAVTIALLLAFAIFTAQEAAKEYDTPIVYAVPTTRDGKLETLRAAIGARGTARQHNVAFDLMPETKDKPMRGGHLFAALIDPGSTTTDIELDVGDYFIMMRADSGQFRETLNMTLVDGQVHQSIRILNDQNVEIFKMNSP